MTTLIILLLLGTCGYVHWLTGQYEAEANWQGQLQYPVTLEGNVALTNWTHRPTTPRQSPAM
ncbi:MAG TPA: hypothetical protein VG754_07500 [Verrucomicrobiae bacterium]|nr:hypothetical protein [Verrucomicrobiae bacterium]